MDDLRALLDRIETYKDSHASYLLAGHNLQAERDAIISLGKSIGFFAARLQHELPKVPMLRGAEESHEGQSNLLAMTELPPAAPAAIASSDEKPCADMTDVEICLGHLDIVARWRIRDSAEHQSEHERAWLEARLGAFEAQIQARGLTPHLLGAMSFRWGMGGNCNPFIADTLPAKEWTEGWLDEQAKGIQPASTGKAAE